MTVPRNPRSYVVDVINGKSDKSQSGSITSWCASQWKAILAELVATMLLITFGCMSCIPTDGILPPLMGPLGFGLAVMYNIQIFGHLSGAYMNPFIAIIAVIFGRISVAVGIAFIIVECIGATLGYGIVVAISPVDMVGEGICLTVPAENINTIQALGIEIALTTALSLITCALWDSTYADRQDSAALKFGLTIAGLSIAGGHLTGAGMNPARSLGPAIWAGRWDIHWVYWVGPLVGGIVPASFYKYVWLNYNKESPKVEPLPQPIENENKF